MGGLMEKLFTAYYRDVYTYLYSLSRDAVLSEDLAAEVFLEAVRSISSFRRESEEKTWLFAIARHRWYAHLRRQKRQASLPLADPQDWGLSPQEQVERKALAERARALLDQEPERTRQIVLMRLEGYSFYEIGQAHGISENTARVIDFRARTKIREKLKKEGFGDA